MKEPYLSCTINCTTYTGNVSEGSTQVVKKPYLSCTINCTTCTYTGNVTSQFDLSEPITGERIQTMAISEDKPVVNLQILPQLST